MIFFEEGYDEEGKWLKLKDLFPNILRSKKQKDDFTSEVRKVEYTYTKIREKLRNSTSKISPIVLWENESGTYPNIHLLVQSLFVLPYSSVPVERIFSNLKDIKSPKRSKLTLDNSGACLLGYQMFKSEDFRITEAMVENYIEKKKVVTTKIIKEKSIESSQLSLEKGTDNLCAQDEDKI